MTLEKNKGLTLIEITIVAFLFSIILVSVFSALGVARTSWKSGASQITVQQEARRGLNQMTKELRQARLATIAGVPTDGAGYPSITFQIPDTITASGTTWSSNIQYSIGGLNNTQLIKTQDGNQRILANNVSLLTFTRNVAEPDVIDISIGVQKDTFSGFTATQSNITLNSKAKVRID